MNVSICEEALSYYQGTSQHIAIYIHICASLTSIFVTIGFLLFGRNLIYFHTNFKFLLYVLLSGYLLHGISLAGLQIVHAYVLHSAKNLCELYLPNSFCYWARFPSAAATNLFIYCQMAMILERILATRMLGKYEKFGLSLGVFMAVLVICLSILSVALMFSNWDLTKSTTYCGTSNQYTVKEVFYVTTVSNAIVAFITFLGCFIVMKYNHSLKASDSTIADVLHRYQNSENVTVLKILAPQTTFLGIFLVAYGLLNGISYYLQPDWTSNQIFKSFLTFVNIIPYYTVLSPLLIWSLLKKHQSERKALLDQISHDRTDARQAYFESYRVMWS